MSYITAHNTAEISEKSMIGNNTKIWNHVQIRENATVGKNCTLGKNVDVGINVGDNVKIQNNVSIYCGVVIENGVFIGPHVCFTNDKLPRAINLHKELKQSTDWDISRTLIKTGASIGTNSTILPGITIGKFAMIGAGSVVTKDVCDFGLVYGNPAKLSGYVCKYGHRLQKNKACEFCKVNIKSIENDTNI